MTSTPIRRAQLKAQPFLAWLAANGAEVCTPTNPYEVVRYRAYWKKPNRAETHVIYAKESGLLTFTGASRVHYERFIAGEPMVGMGEPFVSKFDHAPKPEPETEQREGLTARRRARLLKRDGDGCWFCSRAMGNDVTLEHLVPRSRGGGNNSANLVLAHAACNQAAANLSISEKVGLREKLRSEQPA